MKPKTQGSILHCLTHRTQGPARLVTHRSFRKSTDFSNLNSMNIPKIKRQVYRTFSLQSLLFLLEIHWFGTGGPAVKSIPESSLLMTAVHMYLSPQHFGQNQPLFVFIFLLLVYYFSCIDKSVLLFQYVWDRGHQPISCSHHLVGTLFLRDMLWIPIQILCTWLRARCNVPRNSAVVCQRDNYSNNKLNRHLVGIFDVTLTSIGAAHSLKLFCLNW